MELDSDNPNEEWLKRTLIVVCPNLEALIIATAQKFVILGRSKSTDVIMNISAKVVVTDEEHVYITAVSSFGIAPSALNTSSKSLPIDWFCICIVSFFL